MHEDIISAIVGLDKSKNPFGHRTILQYLSAFSSLKRRWLRPQRTSAGPWPPLAGYRLGRTCTAAPVLARMDGPPWFARLASQRAQVSGYDASHLVSVNTTRTAALARDGEITAQEDHPVMTQAGALSANTKAKPASELTTFHAEYTACDAPEQHRNIVQIRRRSAKDYSNCAALGARLGDRGVRTSEHLPLSAFRTIALCSFARGTDRNDRRLALVHWPVHMGRDPARLRVVSRDGCLRTAQGQPQKVRSPWGRQLRARQGARSRHAADCTGLGDIQFGINARCSVSAPGVPKGHHDQCSLKVE
jgi:hypothetical protein